MRLFLSSENFGKYPGVLADITGKKKVAYIGNAKDYGPTSERAAKIAEHRQQFSDLGFEFEEIDLRDYFDAKVPADILDGFGLVWCSGGNTFLLRSAMKQSGLDKILISKVKADKVAYGGSSAGSVVAGPTLRGTEHGDDPGHVDEVYKADVVWDGLGLVDTVIVPHWGSDWFGAEAEKMAGALDDSGHTYECLEDGQVFVVNGDKVEVLK